MPTQKSFDQLLINMNLYQQAKNLAISLFIFHLLRRYVWLKNPDWLTTFWTISQQLIFPQNMKFLQEHKQII